MSPFDVRQTHKENSPCSDVRDIRMPHTLSKPLASLIKTPCCWQPHVRMNIKDKALVDVLQHCKATLQWRHPDPWTCFARGPCLFSGQVTQWPGGKRSKASNLERKNTADPGNRQASKNAKAKRGWCCMTATNKAEMRALQNCTARKPCDIL